MENVFKRGERNTYNDERNLKLGEFVAKFKEDYDADIKKTKGRRNMTQKKKDIYQSSRPLVMMPRLCDLSTPIWLMQEMMILSSKKQLSLHHVHIPTCS